MIDRKKQSQIQEKKNDIRKRMRTKIDPENYEYYPERKIADYYDTEISQRVAVYVRVSTDDIKQTTSFELQQRYYRDYIQSHPNWTLFKIYADEGISGTSAAHRTQFSEMLADAKAGQFDLIITKSVSRLARNVVLAISVVRELAELHPPVGVFFESEAIFSLKDESQMALSFVATMAEEESHIRSRSMETSLRMRLDNGIPLTPKLLGYTHDGDGNLVINPEEAPTVKLIFYMYLYGYSSQQIADILITLGRKSYLGNIKWTPNGVVQVLKNERHCGEVLTRKTFTENYRTHRTLKNRGERPQSRYLNHHEAIVSRDDFIAVQRMLENAKYGNRSFLPELRVIDSGLLKGFVVINPRWSGFSAADYFQAAQSVCPDFAEEKQENNVISFQSAPGDFDLRGFEVVRTELFDIAKRPAVTIDIKKIKFSSACVHQFGEKNRVELLINPLTKQFAVRSADSSCKYAVVLSKAVAGKHIPKDITGAAFLGTLYALLGWNTEYRYRITGHPLVRGPAPVYIFNVNDCEVLLKPSIMSLSEEYAAMGAAQIQPITSPGKYVRAIPKEWTSSFGQPFYQHEQPLTILKNKSQSDWELWLQGQVYNTGNSINVTAYDELRTYIQEELSGLSPQEE